MQPTPDSDAGLLRVEEREDHRGCVGLADRVPVSMPLRASRAAHCARIASGTTGAGLADRH